MGRPSREVHCEALEISEAELDAEIDKLAKASIKEEKKIRVLYRDKDRRERLKDRMLEEKVLSRIREAAKIREVTIKPKKKSRIITR